jgi:hypothetical protein
MSRHRKPEQRSFNDIELGMISLPIKPKGFERKFREACDRLIPDTVFDKLYSDYGRPARSPSMLTRLLLLQLRDGTSDERIVDDLYYDLRVRYMCDFALDANPVHPTNLVYHRLRLLYGTIYRDKIAQLRANGFSERDSPLQGVFDRVKQAAMELGLVDPESAQVIDSTAILGRAAVMDSYALIFSGIRATLKEYESVCGDGAKELVQKLRRREYLEDVSKPRIDWGSDSSRAELLNDLVYDAVSVLGAGLTFEDKELQGLLEQLATLVGQDVEVSEDRTGVLKIGTSPDRQISTVDPEMRHGRKSKSRKFNGYKGTIAADPQSGVITAVHVMGANEHDSTAVVPVIEQQKAGGEAPAVLIGDRAYAAEEPRHEAMKQGVAVVTKPNTNCSGAFGKFSFVYDQGASTLTCPGGQVRSTVGRNSVHFGSKLCLDCPYRGPCLGKSGKRTIRLREHEALQQDAERFAQTEKGKELLLLRPIVERVIAHWVRNGVRQARYFGRLKVWLQSALAAIMCNLHKIANCGETSGPNGLPNGYYPGVCRFIVPILELLGAICVLYETGRHISRMIRYAESRTLAGPKKALCSGDS